ncbi:P-II family nitrogen regulator [Heliobacillus mobilis]|uniref:P-II family nitrogen regulator n=2 Tax=Heliobacterium TaxID=2697 RepID=A0A6I3SJX3_HELMO|nr:MULTISPECIES: P-II family nitrogen regulator [Heliobacterium]MBC9785148.1 P-II family nitrogen regulator [Heliobacterium chlorum]MTV49214.1 P-II family nitrogen regulator [Heliobacterium mobile]BAD95751.1 nifI1 [Heliobacterium chlorum]BAE93900.1 GlnB-like protein 1 [Heliobacterium chlorum]
MKMIRAIIRPERAEVIAEALAQENLFSLTKMHVFGRGKTKGMRIGDVVYDEFPKTMLLMVVEDESVEKAVQIIVEAGKTGSMGDGKIFVTPVEEAYTVRTGARGL